MENKRPNGAGNEPAAKRPHVDNEFDDDFYGDDDAANLDDLLKGGVIVDSDSVEAGRNWPRPPLAPLSPTSDTITFQQIDIDYVLGNPHRELLPNTPIAEAPILRVFGVNDAGNSVCAFVHGFEPYFFVPAPTANFTPEDCEAFRKSLDDELRSSQKRARGMLVTKVLNEPKTSIWYFQKETNRPFLKIIVATPNLVAPLRTMFDRGVNVPGIGRKVFSTYESNVLFTLRFMIDCGVTGCSWVQVPAGKYKVRESRLTHAQIEVDVHYKDLIAHPPEGDWSRIAPLRILSVDIECAGRKGHFPEPQHDPVIQIASLITVHGKGPVVKNIMTLGSCASIVGAEVMSFESEADLLLRWRDLMIKSDPDIIIGYNIVKFDLPYLIDRAETLGLTSFPYWGRLRGSKLRMRDTTFSSKAYGTKEYKEITIEGRVQLDMLMMIQRDYKLSSYSLNSVSAHFLGEQKEDVHHSCIADLQNGNEETRRRLAVYCLKDSYLPQRLFDKLMYMFNYTEMSRVTGVPLSYLLTRGQSIKVFTQILRKAREKGLLVPFVRGGAQADGVAYEGATVLEARAGYYEMPVATLDFASLYPSIMMAHNLCYSTLLKREDVSGMREGGDYTKTPNGDCFVLPSVRRGILPEILEELLGARKRAKNDLKKETDPFKKAVLDGRQLALKVSANSVYGFTGATVGKMPCLEISSSVTAFGRTMIEKTRDHVQETFNKKNGYEADCEVIYGDTDSVMVNFKVPSLERAMELGQKAAECISATFTKPIKLEFEKVYYPYLLISKKRYAGLYWTRTDKYDKMDTKGIETVRRDNCLLVRNVISTCLEKILIERDLDGAIKYVKGVIADLLQNRMDLSLLVITKGLTQDADDYETKAAHVELAKRMRKRDPVTAPQIGDRVPYVIVKAAKGAKAYEKAEDPIYALEHNLPIDAQHYLEHHLENPLMRIFEPIMKNPRELLTGDHTRAVTIITPSAAAGGIMRFAQRKLTCLGCKAPLSEGQTALCKHCGSREAEIFFQSLQKANELEESYSKLWTECQRCQGSLHQDVLCTSRDCPIYYRRKKVAKDLEEANGVITRFNDW